MKKAATTKKSKTVITAAVKPVVKKTAAKDQSRAVGRRKRASARVRIEKGNGQITVNGQPMAKYFPYFELQEMVLAPLKTLAKEKDLDVSIKVVGGGKNGQAISAQHGLSRALVKWNEDFKKTLKTQGYLTRDPRVKERKKFGLKRARRAPQWSKR